jgi:hypothetical protein
MMKLRQSTPVTPRVMKSCVLISKEVVVRSFGGRKCKSFYIHHGFRVKTFLF